MSTSSGLPKRLPYGLLAGVAFAVAVLAVLWIFRPWLHGPAMIVYRYPLVTWMPFVLFLAVTGAGYVIAAALGRLRTSTRNGRYYGPAQDEFVAWPAAIGAIVAFCQFLVCVVFLSAWQGHAMYEASTYEQVSSLPAKTQPRLLPKAAASEYGDRNHLLNAHLVVNPATGELTWSAEKPASGVFHSGASKSIAIQPLDRINGQMTVKPVVFKPSVSKNGIGSIAWKAYKSHYFTTLTDKVIVPLADGTAVAILPYVGYKGFFVKRRYWKGVYVYHQDGSMEDLTPQEATARRELAASGRLYPEDLARDVAEAYGYKGGVANAIPSGSHDGQTQVQDPAMPYGASDNPQPYLTNLGDGRISWVSVGHPVGDSNAINAVFLTDATTGKTQVWTPAAGQRLLSNQGAARLAHSLDLQWERTTCCDSDGYSSTETIRWVSEPRPVFNKGRFYYLVSIQTDPYLLPTREPVENTVLIDALDRRIVKVYDHQQSSEADDSLRAFFGEQLTPIN
jgi:hypothetical protein